MLTFVTFRYNYTITKNISEYLLLFSMYFWLLQYKTLPENNQGKARLRFPNLQDITQAGILSRTRNVF